MLCSSWWCRKHVREYLPVVWTDEPNFVGYLKSANIYFVRFLCEFETFKSHICVLVTCSITSTSVARAVLLDVFVCSAQCIAVW